MDESQSDKQSLFERLGEILNTPLPGTKGSEKSAKTGNDEGEENESSILDSIREILSQPLPGTQMPDEPAPKADGEQDTTATPVEPLLDEDDWWERDWDAFKQHQEKHRQGFHLKQRQDMDTFGRFQEQEKQRFDVHQQQEFEHFRLQQQWKLDAWKRQIEQGIGNTAPAQPWRMAPPPPPPPPIPGIPPLPWIAPVAGLKDDKS